MTDRFRNKLAVVLGASSEGGVGWRVAERFAEEGARVIVAARREDGIRKLAGRISAQYTVCDISREADVRALAALGMESGGIDIAVNAAGQLGQAMVSNFEQAMLEHSMAVNCYGNLYFFRHMAQSMPRGGAITSIASITVTQVVPGQLLYACAKSAAVTAARYAALEYASKGVRINMLIPGLIDTPMISEVTASDALLQPWLKESPLHRISDATEIANAILWVSESASVTGTSILIDGGMHMRRPPQPDEFPYAEYRN